jgi:hypothetical protein
MMQSATGPAVPSPSPEKIPMSRAIVVHVPGDIRDLEDYLHGQVWAQVPAWTARAVPCFLARTEAGVQSLPGSSTLTETGVQTNPLPVQGRK